MFNMEIKHTIGCEWKCLALRVNYDYYKRYCEYCFRGQLNLNDLKDCPVCLASLCIDHWRNYIKQHAFLKRIPKNIPCDLCDTVMTCCECNKQVLGSKLTECEGSNCNQKVCCGTVCESCEKCFCKTCYDSNEFCKNCTQDAIKCSNTVCKIPIYKDDDTLNRFCHLCSAVYCSLCCDTIMYNIILSNTNTWICKNCLLSYVKAQCLETTHDLSKKNKLKKLKN